MAKFESEVREKELPSYKPKHGSGYPGKVTKEMGDDVSKDSWAPGWGGTDGVQTEGSTEEVNELLEYNMDSKETEIGDDGINVRSSATGARYSKDYNKA